MMISETKSILSFPDLIARQLIRIHYTCFTVFVQFILGPLGRVALSPTAQMIEAEFSSLYASNRLDTDVRYSANSGYAILSGGISTGYFYAFQMLKPDEDFSGFDQYLSLSIDTNEIVKTTAEEYEQTIKDHMRTPEEGETQLIHTDLDYPYQLILNVILSPDGHYAMLNTSAQSMDGSSRNLFLVRLDDLAVRKISGLDASEIQVGAMAGPYQIMIEWNTDDLIIGTKSGIKTYRFDY